MKQVLNLLYFFLLIVLTIILLSCSSTKESTKTEIQIEERIDTVFVPVEERIDTVKAKPKELDDFGLQWEGYITDLNKKTGKTDTIFRVKFLPQDTVFIFEQKKDSIEYVHRMKDTTTYIETTTVIKEPNIIEQWWWLPVLILVLILAIFIIVKMKR